MIDSALNEVLSLLGIAVAALLMWAALAPFEALGWWAGWFGDEIYIEEPAPEGPVRARRPNPQAYIVFLSGISRVSGETFSRREQNFLRRLAETLPEAVVIDDIFPYAVNNLPLTGQRFFAGLWRWALRRKFSDNWLERLAGYLINVRNIWQVAISIDKRYGPIYNQAMAHVILHGLARFGHDPAQKTPIFIIGYSGAGQIAVGAVPYLKELVAGPVYVISLGGIFGSDPGLLAADHIYHIYGTRDRPQRLCAWLFPGRWPLLWYSDWNRAQRLGRVTFLCTGPMSHTGPTGYLTTSRTLPDGTPYLERTVQMVAEIVRSVIAQSEAAPSVDA
ncbi:MAG: hypothetical protein D6790_18010 [Caldilineae bacterium]|nr:MAG: hypothetical protein D6790_18010 [Caldilineae bacterium]